MFSKGVPTAIALSAISIAVLFVYGRALKAPFIFDDYINIVYNKDFDSSGRFLQKLIYYSPVLLPNKNNPTRPFLFMTFTWNHYWNGLRPFGYRIANVAIHAANAFLIIFLAKMLLKKIQRPEFIHLPVLTALLFAVHPLNTEAVTYISNRSDSLATLFYLVSLLSFLKGSIPFIVASLASFLLGSLTKEICLTLPALLLWTDYLFISESNLKKLSQRKYVHLAYWVLLALFLIFRYRIIGQTTFGGGGIEKSWTHVSYFFTQTFVVLRYLALLTFPVGQCIDHWIRPATSIGDRRVVFALMVWCAFFFIFYMRVKRQKDPELAKLFIFSAIWFFLALAPTSSFFPIYDPMVERRAYLPGIGFFMGLTSAGLAFAGRFKPGKNFAAIMFLIYGAFFGFQTWKRNGLYLDPASLWKEAIERCPVNDRAYNNLGQVYAERKDFRNAEKAFSKAAELNPSLGSLRYNLAKARYELGKPEEAMIEYRKAIELDPRGGDAYLGLSEIHYQKKDIPEAVRVLKNALERDLSDESKYAVYNALGIFYALQKDFALAEKAFKAAIALNADSHSAKRNLSRLISLKKEN